jgi:hypothetical protein
VRARYPQPDESRAAERIGDEPRVLFASASIALILIKASSSPRRRGTVAVTHNNLPRQAALFLRQNLAGQRYFARLQRKHGKGKTLSILAHKLARAVYHMLTRQQAFDLERFMSAP